MPRNREPQSFEPQYEEITVTSIRKVIAQRLLESKRTIPHFYLFDEFDMEEVVRFRDELNSSAPSKISFNDMIVKSVAVALDWHPECNVSYAGGRLRRYREININIAVAIEGGLLVPVLRNCEGKSLAQISRDTKEIVDKARSKKMRPREGLGGTFTISNLGVFGLDGSFSIINPPQAMIFTTGAIKQKPVVKAGELAVGTRMKVTLSCDHRAVDGAVGAQFLSDLRNIMEHPRDHLV